MADEFDDFDDFSDVSNGTGSNYPEIGDLLGCTVLIKPYESGTRQSKNSTEEYTWVECDVQVIRIPETGWPLREGADEAFFGSEKAGYTIEGFQFSGKNLAPVLQRKMKTGGRLLARVAQGKASQKGFSKPWLFEPAEEADFELAKKIVAATKAKAAAAAKAKGDADFEF